jgi:ABC-2 type transport system ATP-binding protein
MKKQDSNSKRIIKKRNKFNFFIFLKSKSSKITNKFISYDSYYFKKGSLAKDAPILKVNNITKEFSGFKALQNISFQIEKGERIGLIGGNGAGKTTLSEIIAGIDIPTKGNIEYGFDFTISHKENIGMQFQQSEYPSGLTVKDIVLFARNLRKLDISSKELLKFLKIFQMEDFYNRKVRSLSGGQKQKLNILLSLIHNPKLVILDELSTGLDISARDEIILFTNKLLKEKNISSILISHHMDEIKRLCNKVIILVKGKVKEIKLIKDIEKEYGSLDNYCKKVIGTKIEGKKQKKSFNTKKNFIIYK